MQYRKECVRNRVHPTAGDLRLDRQTEQLVGKLIGDRKRNA